MKLTGTVAFAPQVAVVQDAKKVFQMPQPGLALGARSVDGFVAVWGWSWGVLSVVF